MSDSSNLTQFDFSKPSGLGAEKFEHLSHWIQCFCTSFNEKWTEATNVDVALQLDSCDVYSFENSKRRIPKPAVGSYVDIGPIPFRSLVVFSQPMSLAMVCQLLGENLDELPDDRAMTGVEETLYEVFISHLVDSLSDSWPEKEPLVCMAGPIEHEPHRSRMLGPREIVLICKTTMKLCGTDIGFDWLLPHKELEQLISSTDEVMSTPQQQSPAVMQELASQIPVELSMTLGTCKLSVSSLSNLQAGDILVLDQMIDEPMPVRVSNKIKFYGWLGRNNNKRAYKICRLANSKDKS